MTVAQRTRPCRKHGGPHPAHDFPLLTDEQAKARGWATRYWCGPCLVAGGHIAKGRLIEHRAATERKWRAAAAEARQARLAADLADKARTDPVFREALVAAARKVA